MAVKDNDFSCWSPFEHMPNHSYVKNKFDQVFNYHHICCLFGWGRAAILVQFTKSTSRDRLTADDDSCSELPSAPLPLAPPPPPSYGTLPSSKQSTCYRGKSLLVQHGNSKTYNCICEKSFRLLGCQKGTSYRVPGIGSS